MISLTTTDNPYNPFDDFEAWEQYDREQGYNTCAYLARVVDSNSPSLIEEENIKLAIDEIIKINPKLYKIINIPD
jgi:hypothetical protein